MAECGGRDTTFCILLPSASLTARNFASKETEGRQSLLQGEKLQGGWPLDKSEIGVLLAWCQAGVCLGWGPSCKTPGPRLPRSSILHHCPSELSWWLLEARTDPYCGQEVGPELPAPPLGRENMFPGLQRNPLYTQHHGSSCSGAALPEPPSFNKDQSRGCAGLARSTGLAISVAARLVLSPSWLPPQGLEAGCVWEIHALGK